MIPLFIYKDTHLQRQITKIYSYENKGVEKQMKRSGSLQCRGLTPYYVRMRNLLMTLHVTGKNCEFGKYTLYPNLVRGKSREKIVYNSSNE